MGKPEGTVEDHMAKRARQRGFLYYKFTSPSTNGVPDRILIGHGLTIFVELKAPGKKPRKLQDIVIADMRAHGANVFVIDTKVGVDAFFDEIESAYLF